MSRSYITSGVFLIVALFALYVNIVADTVSPSTPTLPNANLRDVTLPAATVRPATVGAASGATITFITQNGRAVADVPPRAMDVPHLVLYRNGALTAPVERTLVVELNGLPVPAGGATVTLEVETQHGDPDLGGDYRRSPRIPVWRESRWLSNSSGANRTSGVVLFTHEFTATAKSGTETIATPTDYYRYTVAVIDPERPIANPAHVFSADYAFLMENQWTARLPEVSETSTGAAPDELIAYYCDMFPFHQDIDDPASWLLREHVTGYIGSELLPQMVEAFRIQTDEWGFPWHDAWTSWRPGEDAERLSVALSDGATWFHGLATPGGFSDISIGLKGSGKNYATLTDGLMSAFHHELFHNLQRTINQHHGGDGDVGGKENAWAFFSEGTAVLASAVGQPLVQFDQTRRARAYIANANSFVGGHRYPGDLNTSYRNMYPNRAAMYWRFLYEGCGGIKNPAAGMDIIKRALTALYSRAVVDIASSTAVVENIPVVLDQALLGSSCPFSSYEESLIAFGRAIYALRLEDGRCAATGKPDGCGFYDPHNLYHDPPIDTIPYAGADLEYRDGIKSSFGMDFVDVNLDPAADGQRLTLTVLGAPGADSEFNLQLWKLMDSGGDAKPRRATGPSSGTEMVTTTSFAGQLTYEIPAIDVSAYNRLALIITRLDAQESVDPFGAYSIVLKP